VPSVVSGWLRAAAAAPPRGAVRSTVANALCSAAEARGEAWTERTLARCDDALARKVRRMLRELRRYDE
jgi:hypothetical protein